MKPKTKLMIGVFAVVVATGVLVGSNFSDSLAYMRRPSELKTLNEQDLGRRMRLGGVVMPGSVVKFKKTQLKEFVLFEKDTGVKVKFEGILPDLFQENKPALVEGYLKGSTFQADLVMAKHDENYVPSEMVDLPPSAMVAPPLGPETAHLIYEESWRKEPRGQ